MQPQPAFPEKHLSSVSKTQGREDSGKGWLNTKFSRKKKKGQNPDLAPCCSEGLAGPDYESTG